MVNLDSLSSTTSTRSVGQQLRLYATIHGPKQEGRSVYRLGHGQDAVVLEDDGFLVVKGRGDVFTLFGVEGNAAEVVRWSGRCKIYIYIRISTILKEG